MLSYQLSARKPLGGVGVKAYDVFAGCRGGEGPLALGAVHLGQDDLVVWIPDLNVHPNARTRRCKTVGSWIV